MKIFVNAGHCIGKDSGAVGFGLTEAQKVFNIGKQVDKILPTRAEKPLALAIGM